MNLFSESKSKGEAVGLPYLTLKRATASLYEPSRGKKESETRREKCAKK